MLSTQLDRDMHRYDAEHHQQHDFERLRRQCLSAMSELEILRKQHSEIMNRCELAVQEADYLRKQNRSMVSQCDELSRDKNQLQFEYEDVVSDRDKLRQDYEEIVLLREQEKIESNGRARGKLGSDSDTEKSTEVFGTLQRENEDLKYSYDDLKAGYDSLSSDFKKLEEELVYRKEQCDGLASERDALIVERNALKQQCSAAIRGYEKALLDRDEAVRESLVAKHHRDATEQALKLKIQQLASDINKLREERNAALHEYKLIMSERDSVHQEIEKLQDDLGTTKQEAQKLENDREKVIHEKEGLRQEILSVLDGRDKALKEMHDLRLRLHEALSEKETMGKQLEGYRQEVETLKQEKDAARKERGEAIVHRDKILKECFEVKRLFASMDRGQDETERLKLQFDKLSHELANAWKEAEIAMKRRDWFFNERDKVVRQLEEMKDKYRKLADEKQATTKERDKLRLQLAKVQRFSGLMKGSTCLPLAAAKSEDDERGDMTASHDSAIDTDAPSYHIEDVTLERPSSSDDFGFLIQGGVDSPLSDQDVSILVTDVAEGSPADGKLKPCDLILRINNQDVTNVDLRVANEAIYQKTTLTLTILRPGKTGSRSPLHRVQFKRSEEKEIGLSIDSGLHIKRIEPESLAADDEMLSIGDKILSINGCCIDDLEFQEAKVLLSQSMVSLTILKPSVSVASSHASLEEHRMSTATAHPYAPSKSTAVHFRSPSAPVRVSAQTEEILATVSGHLRSNSLASGASSSCAVANFKHCSSGECELQANKQRIADARPEGRRKTSRENRSSLSEYRTKKEEVLNLLSADPVNALLDSAQRSGSFKSAVGNTSTESSSLQTRPASTALTLSLIDHAPVSFRRQGSAPDSRQSFASSGSFSRYSHLEEGRITPSSPLNANPSDPLALSSKPYATSSSVNTSVTSVGSTGVRSGHPGPRNWLLINHRTSYPASLHDVHHGRSPGYRPVVEHGHPAVSQQDFRSDSPYYGTFPGKRKVENSSDSSYAQSRAYNSRNSSTKSPIVFSGSSHGSINSSEASDRVFASSIVPVHEVSHESLKGVVGTAVRRTTSPAATSSSMRRGSLASRLGSRTPDERSRSPRVVSMPTADKLGGFDEEPRGVVIEKGPYPLGITIASGANGGIFVAGLNEDSIASKYGLRYGDQLLECNGLNLRNANYEQAARILQQSAVESTVTVLAQYNIRKMLEKGHDAPASSHSVMHMLTSCGSAGSAAALPHADAVASHHARINSNTSTSSDHSRKTIHDGFQLATPCKSERRITAIPEDDAVEEEREVSFKRIPPSAPLGLCIIGGNAFGIFVSDINDDSVASGPEGLKAGDKILEYNSLDMRTFTLEEATLELGKPTEFANFLVQYNPPGYRKAQGEPGDAFYVRAMYDRDALSSGELAFRRGDVLYVVNTLYKGQLGIWEAVAVSENDEPGTVPRKAGKIPSRMKAEQELLLRRSVGEDKLKGRYSLFRRSKKGHQQSMISSHSRESSDSKGDDVAIAASSVSVIHPDVPDLVVYQSVTLCDTLLSRPVVVLGALAEPICDKLVMEVPYKFARCLPEISQDSLQSVEKGVQDGRYIDFAVSRKGKSYACITPDAIRDVMTSKSKHCLLDVRPEAVERLHPLNLHPIIIFIRYKSAKTIKMLRDGHYIKEKISTKASKDMLESNFAIEREFKNIFTVALTAHSLNSICKEIVDTVQNEQRKKIWIQT